jgi:hypothetical protein
MSGYAHVRNGSKGDVGGRLLLIWFTPNSGSAVRYVCLNFSINVSAHGVLDGDKRLSHNPELAIQVRS